MTMLLPVILLTVLSLAVGMFPTVITEYLTGFVSGLM